MLDGFVIAQAIIIIHTCSCIVNIEIQLSIPSYSEIN